MQQLNVDLLLLRMLRKVATSQDAEVWQGIPALLKEQIAQLLPVFMKA